MTDHFHDRPLSLQTTFKANHVHNRPPSKQTRFHNRPSSQQTNFYNGPPFITDHVYHKTHSSQTRLLQSTFRTDHP